MLYAPIIGDIVGSRFEFSTHKPHPGFELFTDHCMATDDSVLTCAVANALLKTKDLEDYKTISWNTKMEFLAFESRHPYAGYGYDFIHKFINGLGMPYNSCGSGAASRVSPVAYCANTLKQAELLSDAVTSITHNHPEGLKGARAVTSAVFLAKEGKQKQEIRDYIQQNYYPLDFSISEIRDQYEKSVLCQHTVPQAIVSFLEADSFECAIRKAVSLGGDTDTIACITASIAGPFFGIPYYFKKKANSFLDNDMIQVIRDFDYQFPISR